MIYPKLKKKKKDTFNTTFKHLQLQKQLCANYAYSKNVKLH